MLRLALDDVVDERKFAQDVLGRESRVDASHDRPRPWQRLLDLGHRICGVEKRVRRAVHAEHIRPVSHDPLDQLFPAQVLAERVNHSDVVPSGGLRAGGYVQQPEGRPELSRLARGR